MKQFAPFLPAFVVRPYAYALPAIEAVIGVLLLIGLAQRWALVAGALFMASLTFGTALRGEHAVLSEQLIYEFVYFILLATLAWDRYSLDRAISDRKATSAT